MPHWRSTSSTCRMFWEELEYVTSPWPRRWHETIEWQLWQHSALRFSDWWHLGNLPDADSEMEMSYWRASNTKNRYIWAQCKNHKIWTLVKARGLWIKMSLWQLGAGRDMHGSRIRLSDSQLLSAVRKHDPKSEGLDPGPSCPAVSVQMLAPLLLGDCGQISWHLGASVL